MPDKIERVTSRTKTVSQNETKKERDKFYRGKRWIKVSKLFLSRNPLCALCALEKIDKEASTVHHIIERLQLPQSEWYKTSNLQSLCASCHSKHHASKPKP